MPTICANDDAEPVNVAVTFFAADIVTVQVDVVPVQSPIQPVKVEPEFGVAVRVTEVDVSAS
ncbi:MAG: hypothetical protein HQL05_04930 [Nitrospirae bacterium]|nr:hypothetical protein [Candidatus Magnetobacterium casensis]MBF0337158.1 hypothetical protein [Nitrospirota bacterium]